MTTITQLLKYKLFTEIFRGLWRLENFLYEPKNKSVTSFPRFLSLGTIDTSLSVGIAVESAITGVKCLTGCNIPTCWVKKIFPVQEIETLFFESPRNFLAFRTEYLLKSENTFSLNHKK
jgi:hypothetical protein